MFDKGQKQSSALSCDSSYPHFNAGDTHVDFALNRSRLPYDRDFIHIVNATCQVSRSKDLVYKGFNHI